MQTQETTDEQSPVLHKAYKIADSIQEVGEAAWEKVSVLAKDTYQRLVTDTPTATEESSPLAEPELSTTSVSAPPVGRGPSGVDVVASAGPPEEVDEPPPFVDARTTDVENIAPIGSGMAKDMLRRAQGE